MSNDDDRTTKINRIFFNKMDTSIIRHQGLSTYIYVPDCTKRHTRKQVNFFILFFFAKKLTFLLHMFGNVYKSYTLASAFNLYIKYMYIIQHWFDFHYIY